MPSDLSFGIILSIKETTAMNNNHFSDLVYHLVRFTFDYKLDALAVFVFALSFLVFLPLAFFFQSDLFAFLFLLSLSLSVFTVLFLLLVEMLRND